MVRPHAFGHNPQTAVNNLFQLKTTRDAVPEKALHEFDTLVTVLQTRGVEVHVVQDTEDPHTPDALFPNNWISFHETGQFFLYPMFAANRRAERKASVLKYVAQQFSSFQRVDLSFYEQEDFFLEGTGSMVLDRDAKIAYACRSPRTHERVLRDFCTLAGYTPCIFDATDLLGYPYYHTNVMMTVTRRHVIVCLDSIVNEVQRQQLKSFIQESKKQLLVITRKQVTSFAGNMLELQGHDVLPLLVMSTQAFLSLTPLQCEQISCYNEIVHCSLSTIEEAGGGSARCMLTEIPG
ncbi:MAG: amidinotransferase [Bacteroidetes bacterium]|nr:amidinotransferase [Bacteroidota bacterium]